MRFLVTGGAGFIGSHLVRHLVNLGHRVRVLDNLSTGRPARLKEFINRIEVQLGDVRDPSSVAAAVEGVDRIIHLAAQVSISESLTNPLRSHAINATGTMMLLDAARQANVRRVVLASSCHVYGHPEHVPTPEGALVHPLSPYAQTKLVAEDYAQLYRELYNLECVSLRIYHTYGPGQDAANPYAAVIPRFLTTMREGRQPVIFGDGQQTRDFIYIEDVVRALVIASMTHGLQGGAYNVGSGEPRTVLELFSAMRNVLGQQVEPEFAPAQPNELRYSYADMRRFEQATGFRTRVSLMGGLALTAQSMGLAAGFALNS